MILKKLGKFFGAKESVIDIKLKVVYCGPDGSGKSTNLGSLHENIEAREKEEITRLTCDGDLNEATTLFEAIPTNVTARSGYQFSCGVYEANGELSRGLILNGVQGIIFVADSNPDAQDANVEALTELESNLSKYMLSLDSIPWVLQYNKRDLTDAVDVNKLNQILNKRNVPFYEAQANQSIGVVEPFNDVITCIAKNFHYDLIWVPEI
ncbi:MAG TPA: hypothetical protein V6C89_18455 [Drouetiella sp.]|jgi:mutual gliding-motility protein MglA